MHGHIGGVDLACDVVDEPAICPALLEPNRRKVCVAGVLYVDRSVCTVVPKQCNICSRADLHADGVFGNLIACARPIYVPKINPIAGYFC